jgi:hypothetical protein
MSDLYKIGIQLALTGGYAHQMQVLAQQFGMFHAQVGQIQQGIGRWAMALGGVAAIMGGSAILGGIKKLGDHGKEVNHQLELMKIKGMEVGEIQRANAKALEVTSSVLTTSYSENLKHIQELRYAFGDTGTALKYLEVVSKANAVLNAVRAGHGGIGGGGRVDEVFELVKSLEQKGETVNPDAFMRYVDIMTKVVNVTGGRVTPAAFQTTFKYGRTAMLGWDEEFIGEILPRLIQSMMAGRGGAGGSGGPGNALMTGFRQLASNVMSKPAADMFKDLGLATATHERGTTKSFTHVNDDLAKLFIANPYEAIQKIIMPALVKKFGHDRDTLIRQLGVLFPVRTFGAIGTEMALQGREYMGLENSPFEKDRRLTRMAMGIGAFEDLITRDPTTVIMAFHAQMENLGEALGKPVWAPGGIAMTALSRLTVMINAMGRFAAAHPEGLEKALTALAVLGGSLVVGGIVAIAWALGGLALAAGGIAAAAIAITAFAAIHWDDITGPVKAFRALLESFSGLKGRGLPPGAPGERTLPPRIQDLPWMPGDWLKGRGLPPGAPGRTAPPLLPGVPGGAAPSAPGTFYDPLSGYPMPAPSKQRYNAVPPPAGGGSGGGGDGAVYLDGKKVGEIIAGQIALLAGGPLQGSAFFDATHASPASDLSLSYG